MTARANFTRLATAMRARPGQWMPVRVYRARTTADNTARAIRNAYTPPQSGRPSPWAPRLSFPARGVPVEDGARVEARWVGDKSRGGYA
jgi:hypothetical protein